jgi:thioesterase domain-containing protein
MFNEFIEELKEKEIVITFSNGKLQYMGPEQNIDEELLLKLKKYKSKLLKYYWPSDCYNMMPINTEGDKIPLILLHAGEANYSLSNHLGSKQPFYGFFYIGSEGEKIGYKNVESFAGDYLIQLQKIIPQGPYYLGGFSLGGVLAYEMAIKLQQNGFEVPILILVDCEIQPSKNDASQMQKYNKKSSRVKKFLRTIYDWAYYNSIKIFYDFFHIFNINLPVKYRNSYIIWTYSKLWKAYRPDTPFKGKILLFKAEENLSEKEYLGWDRLCNQIQVVIFKGNHRTMYRGKESNEVLNERINDFLNKANENTIS